MWLKEVVGRADGDEAVSFAVPAGAVLRDFVGGGCVGHLVEEGGAPRGGELAQFGVDLDAVVGGEVSHELRGEGAGPCN